MRSSVPNTTSTGIFRLARRLSKGRKGLVRYGGRLGRAVAAAPPDAVPWDAAAADTSFRRYVDDLLRLPDTRVTAILPQASVDDAVELGFWRGDLYPLGLCVTLELTLRRTGAA